MYTLRYYFNKNNQGPQGSYSRLNAAKAQLLQQVERINSFKDVKFVEESLNNFFYPKKENTQAMNILEQFNEALTQAFWNEWEKNKENVGNIETVPINIGMGKYGLRQIKDVKRIEMDILKDYRDKLVANYSNYVQLCLQDQQKVDKLLINLQKVQSETIENVEGAINAINKIMSAVTSRSIGREDAKGNKIKWKGIAITKINKKGEKIAFGRGTAIAGYSRNDIKEIVIALEELLGVDRYSKILSNDDLGEIFEWAITLFNEGIFTAKEMEKEELIEQLKEKVKVGQNTYARNSFLNVSMNIDWFGKGKAEYNTKMVKGKKSIQKRQYLKIGNIEVDITNDLNPGSAKKGKADIIMDKFSGKSSGAIGASLKNWESLDEITGRNQDRGFGQTSLLYALARNHAAYLDYLWALQVPDKEQNKNGYDPSALLNVAFGYAKTALLADIVMGTGFQDNAQKAGSIIINSRTERHIYVFNAAEEIKKVLNGEKSKLKLEGYDENELAVQRSKALDLMAAIKNKHITNAGGLYSFAAANYLNNKKISVTINKDMFYI